MPGPGMPGCQENCNPCTIVTPGEGQEVEDGDTIFVDLESTWTGKDPVTGETVTKKWWNTENNKMRNVGRGRMIHGLDFGVLGMKVNEVREITIAPDCAAGDAGMRATRDSEAVPGGATLNVKVTVKSVDTSTRSNGIRFNGTNMLQVDDHEDEASMPGPGMPGCQENCNPCTIVTPGEGQEVEDGDTIFVDLESTWTGKDP